MKYISNKDKLYLIGVMIVVMCIVSSCVIGIPKRYKSKSIMAHFSNSYEPNRDNRIRNDGYYFDYQRTGYDALAFYPDGTVLSFTVKTEYLDSVGNPTAKLDEQVHNVYGRGIYIIEDDYLTINWPYDCGIFFPQWAVQFHRFEIIDEDTIKLIEYDRNGYSHIKKDRVYHFVKASPLLPGVWVSSAPVKMDVG